MFILDGRPLSPDVAFTHDGVHYPANWLRLATPQERTAIGIQEVPDPPSYDQRFYWGYDQDGQLIPKDHAQLVQQWSDQTRTTANTLLSPSDWMVIREMDNGIPMLAEYKTWRESLRLAAGSKVYELEQTKTTDELAAYVTGPDYSAWPQLNPPTPPADVPAGDEPVASSEEEPTVF